MKKTKQKLVVALATLTAGVLAAGATSTVAWFVANREASFSYNTITVNSNTGALKIKYGGSLLNGEAATGHDNYLPSDSVTMSGDNLKKLYDVSSSDGNNFAKAVQVGADISFAAVTDEGFLRFYLALQNESSEASPIYLKSVSCSITNASGTAADDVRVAVDSLINSVPTGKGSTAVTFMDGGTAKTYAQAGVDTAVYHPAVAASGTQSAVDAYITYDTTLATNDNIILDINAANTANVSLGSIAASTTSGNVTTHGVSYCVVTVWYEGTNVGVQNEDIGDSFNLNLDFVAGITA